MTKTYLVTGGAGFLGNGLVRSLVKQGVHVRILDNGSRGKIARLNDIQKDVEIIEGDIRNSDIVEKACRKVDCVCHLAYVNGTEFFYSKPELVLDIAINGMMNLLNGCLKNTVSEFVLASSSEVYQTPPYFPADEKVPLIIPDILNPRYSYGGGKIFSELVIINYGRKNFERVVIFRPHNVFGPDMGFEHVIPQMILRMGRLLKDSHDPILFPIQGTGKETRSFVYIDDFIQGLEIILLKGKHLEIYNVGTIDEISIEDVARAIGRLFNREIRIIPGELQKGGTLRRVPDISKLAALGYQPKVPFKDGLKTAFQWYQLHSE